MMNITFSSRFVFLFSPVQVFVAPHADRSMAHLLVYKQQQDLEVKFGWPRWHQSLREVIPLLGTPKDGFKASELHKGMVVVIENGSSGLHKRFWIIALLWNSAAMSECMILLNSNYEDASEYAFGVILRNVDDDHNRSSRKDVYHHHKTEWMDDLWHWYQRPQDTALVQT